MKERRDTGFIVIFEMSFPVCWKPGVFRSRFDGTHFYRAWWLCFAIAFVPRGLFDYSNHIESGQTHWISKSGCKF